MDSLFSSSKISLMNAVIQSHVRTPVNPDSNNRQEDTTSEWDSCDPNDEWERCSDPVEPVPYSIWQDICQHDYDIFKTFVDSVIPGECLLRWQLLDLKEFRQNWCRFCWKYCASMCQKIDGWDACYDCWLDHEEEKEMLYQSWLEKEKEWLEEWELL